MREIGKKTRSSRHNDMSLFSSYFCPSTVGTDLEDFMICFTDNICCAPTVMNAQPGDSSSSSRWHSSDYDHRSDLVDPQHILFEKEMRAVSDLEAEYDLISCDSSITSTASMGREHQHRDRVRVFFDASLANTATAVVEPSSPRSRTRYFRNTAEDHGDTRSEATEKSARFNEALNTTLEYIPAFESNSNNNYSGHHNNHSLVNRTDDGIKSEGGRVRSTSIWHKTTDLSILDEHRFDFRVLGTSTRDSSAKPHVLSASIMDALQDYLPYTKRGEMFWLKYSMVRDGASMQTMLNKTRSSDYTILAVETLDGEVFGAFVGKAWQITWAYYGSQESFLWRLRRRRRERLATRAAKALLESDIEVFRFAGQNTNIQLCNTNRIAVGGGSPDDEGSVFNDELSHVRMTEWGFGLAFGEDLQHGTSSPCITFESPALSKIHSDGSRFEVANLEIWTLTPCSAVDAAERMEAGKAMIERCMTI